MGKKLLILFGILILSILSFGAETAEKGISSNTAVNVKAEVVDTLGIEAFPVDFGIIFPGETKTPPETPGKLRIIGRESIFEVIRIKYITLEVKQNNDYVKYEGENQTFNVQLTKENLSSPSDNQKMDAELKLETGEGIGLGNKGITIFGKEGFFNITGSLKAKPSQEEGKYNGVLYVRVKPVFSEF